MEWYGHKLLWDRMGWDRKIFPMDKPGDSLGRPTRVNGLKVVISVERNKTAVILEGRESHWNERRILSHGCEGMEKHCYKLANIVKV